MSDVQTIAIVLLSCIGVAVVIVGVGILWMIAFEDDELWARWVLGILGVTVFLTLIVAAFGGLG